MNFEKTAFGTTPDGLSADLYTLRNAHGLIAKITNFGARVTELHVPDRHGKLADVVLGFDRLQPYLEDKVFHGATVGRFANRLGGGRFTLDGKEFRVTRNEGNNSLHGGTKGFSEVLWKAEPAGPASVRCTYLSPDGDEGYLGNVVASVLATLTDQNELRFDFEATTDAPTHVNMTNHCYFNLAGAGSGTILDHILTIHADEYAVRTAELIPTGEIAPVAATVYDFRTPHTVGERIEQAGRVYDQSFVLRSHGKLALAATLHDTRSGRTMETWTTQPGLQFYAGSYLDGKALGIGGPIVKHGGLCLETQHHPDSPNHPNFPSTLLRPGQVYRETAVYRFGNE